MAAERLWARVSGRVQGVGFRFFVQQAAQSLGLNGWVRNRWDETVELTAEGERAQLEKLLQQVQRGPASAFVRQVEVEWLPAEGNFKDFHVRVTE